jgi:hypothetical protein
MARSNAFGAFLGAAPGARELVTLAKAWERGARSAGRAARAVTTSSSSTPPRPVTASGCFARRPRSPRSRGSGRSQARQVAELLGDRQRSAVVAVAQPAEMSVSETLDLEGRVHDALARDVDAIVVNGVLTGRFSGAEMERLAAADGAVPGGIADAVRRRHGMATAQQSQLRRLRRDAVAPVMTLPFVASGTLGVADVEALADALARRLES